MKTQFNIYTGTVSGTLLSLAPQIASADIYKTVILAAIGATASFVVTLLLKRISRRKDR